MTEKKTLLTKEENTKLGAAESPFTTAPIPQVTEAHMAKEYSSFKEQLKHEKHVDIMIPPTQLYPEGSSMPICVNGVTYTIPVGIDFPEGVPKSIHAAWKYSYDADREARQKMKKKLTGVISIG